MSDRRPNAGRRVGDIRAAADAFQFSLWTNNAALAAQAGAAGVRFVALDFETIGKRARQPDPGAWISDHRPEDVPRIRAVKGDAELLVRVNAPHGGTRREVRAIIAAGADAVMLPMFTCAAEAASFVDAVAGDAEVHLLVETPAALARIDDILAVPGITEISLGLNDLRRAFGLASHFELLLSPLAATVAARVIDAGIRFGFGTLAPLIPGRHPIDPDLVLAQYSRLGGRSARLAPYFIASLAGRPLAPEVAALRARLAYWAAAGEDARAAAVQDLRQAIAAL